MPKKSIFPKDVKEKLKEKFRVLKRKIVLDVFTKKGTNDQFNQFSIQICKELAKLTDKI